MNPGFAATLAVVAFLLAPASAYSADKSTTETIKDAVADSSVTAKIKAEFAKDKTVSATSIKVDTDDSGIVTLSGTAKSKAEADQAVKIARDTNGVVSVKNNIAINDGGARSKDSTSDTGKTASAKESVKEAVGEATVTAKIKAAFVKDKTVSATSIKVDTEDNGVVTLGGHAKSKEEADQAIKLARDTNGVISVKNNIVIGDSRSK
ncbi:MAG: transporter [Betaproteobacteria bacterium]|nr:transporter [Betaproteobacteria bacterium]